MNRRAVLSLVGAGAVPLAGCLGSLRSGTAGDREPDLVASGPGDYAHDVYVHNALDRDVRLSLTVERSGERIYRATHTVPASSGTVVAGITRASLPAGDRRLAVRAVLPDGQSTAVEVDVTDCLGSVDFAIDSGGDLSGTYSIC